VILRAFGSNATVDLFEHHLVITRRRSGLIIGVPMAEHFIPLSSIKSVQFIRPGFTSRGRLVLTLMGSSTAKAGTVTDQNTVFFEKKHLEAFEGILHAIREAIATPSIERLAMSAQRGRVDHNPRPATENHLQRMLPPPSAQGGAQQQNGSGNYENHGASDRETLNPTLGGWWRDLPPVGKVAIVGFACFLLLSVWMADGPSTAETESIDGSGNAPAETTATAAPSGEQMLSKLTEFITGSPGTADIAITDGDGKVGEFCSASSGSNVLSFGGTHNDGKPTGVFDYYYEYRSAEGGMSNYGSYQFDHMSGTLSVHNVQHSRSGSKHTEPFPDLTMRLEQVSEGTVKVDGVSYHSCAI
jgi:hypothetical protein